MKIDRKAIGPDRGLRSKQGIIVRDTKHGAVVQAWPRPRKRARTPYEMYVQTEFAYATSWASNPEPMAYETARNLAKGTQLLPRDILVMAMYGTLYEFTLPDGTVLERFANVAPNPQYILDMISDELGTILWRAPIGWVALSPGNNGQALQIIDQQPRWEDIAPATLGATEFILKSPNAAAPNARVLSHTNSILTYYPTGTTAGFLRQALTGDVAAALDSNNLTIQPRAVTLAKLVAATSTQRVLARRSSGAGDFEECTLSQLLDFVGTAAQGDVLFRAPSSWSRLPAGIAGQVMTTAGPSANPSWQTPTAGIGNQFKQIGMPPFMPSGGTTIGANILTGGVAIVSSGTTFDSVQFYAKAAAATAKITPCVYDRNASHFPQALTYTGPQVTGVVNGLNTIPLAAPVTAVGDVVLFPAIHITVAGISYPAFAGPCWGGTAATIPNPILGGMSFAMNSGACPAWLYKS